MQDIVEELKMLRSEIIANSKRSEFWQNCWDGGSIWPGTAGTSVTPGSRCQWTTATQTSIPVWSRHKDWLTPRTHQIAEVVWCSRGDLPTLIPHAHDDESNQVLLTSFLQFLLCFVMCVDWSKQGHREQLNYSIDWPLISGKFWHYWHCC